MRLLNTVAVPGERGAERHPSPWRLKYSMETPATHEKSLSDEAQLLKEGQQLVKRAVQLSTQTHKIKIWVPIVCSMVLTGYYLYGLHRKSAATMALAEPGPPAVVAAEGPNEKMAAAPEAEPPDARTSAGGGSLADLRKQAQQAHEAQQFGEEAKLWGQFMERSGLPQEACPAIGKAWERAGEIDSAIQANEKCVSLEPGNADMLVSLAHALERKRDFPRATAIYRQVLAKDPKNLDAQTGMALLELSQDHLSAAEQGALKVLGKAPEQTDALLIAGIVAWRESRLPEAERIFLRGAALDDQRADFHGFLGRIAEAERRPQEALRQYDKALSLDPGDAEIAGRRERLQQAK